MNDRDSLDAERASIGSRAVYLAGLAQTLELCLAEGNLTEDLAWSFKALGESASRVCEDIQKLIDAYRRVTAAQQSGQPAPGNTAP